MKKVLYFFQHFSINVKVILAYLVFVVMVGGAGTLLVALNEQAVIQQAHITLARSIAANVAPLLAIQHKMMLNRVATIVGGLPNVRDCAIVDHLGVAVALTDMAMIGQEIPVGPTSRQAYAEQGYYAFAMPTAGLEVIYAPVLDGGQYLGSVLLTFDSTDLLTLLHNPRETTARIIVHVIFFVALFGLAGAFIIIRLISHPIRVLTEKTYKVLAGIFPEKKLPINYVYCWEKLHCPQTICPSYGNKDEKCWTVAGTFCTGEVQGVHAQKLGDCRKCVVYKKNSGDELERLHDGFDLMVRNLRDQADGMRQAKEYLEKYAKELEEANRRNLEMRVYHEQILDSLSSAVISLDEDLRIGAYNRAAQVMLGINLQALVGADIVEIQQECSRCQEFFGIILRAIQRYQQDGRPLIGHEVSVRRLTGEAMTISLNVLPLHVGTESGKNPVIVAFEDITERDKLREELNLSRNLAELGEVAAKVAHDVRNPLNAIEGGIQYLGTRYADDPEIQNIAHLIHGQVKRLDGVTHALLEVSKPMIPHFTACNINELVKESASFLLEEIASHTLVLAKEFGAALPLVRMDSNQFQRVIINLMENAIEATPAGGTITLKTRLLVRPEGGDEVELSVSDTGSGIAAEIAPAVFKPFYTTKINGIGLGLAIVRQIVTQHRGTMQLRQREPGPGTEVIIHLPLNPALSNEVAGHG